MDNNIIHKAISNPEMIAQSGSEKWGEIAQQYPYFSAAHLMLAKSLQQNGDYRFSDQLHQAAVYANDRKVLYRWVKNSAVSKIASDHIIRRLAIDPIAKEISISVTSASVEPTASSSELASLILAIENPEIATIAKLTTTDKNPTSEEGLISAKKHESFETLPESPHAIIKSKDIEPFERELLLEALQSSISTELRETREESAKIDLNTNPEIDDTFTEPQNSYAAYILKRSKQLHFGLDAPTQLEEINSEIAVNDWLRVEQNFSSEIDNNIKSAGSELDEAGLRETNLPRISQDDQKIDIENPKLHQKNLIDRFIRLEPNISRGKVGEYSSGNIAKESLDEDYSMITETIAQLFARQGKMDKARKAYRKLMEQFPEKSVYFAAQLKNLDKLKK